MADGLTGTSFDDTALPVSGAGSVYPVQARHTDRHATSESHVFGTVTGGLAATQISEDALQAITEELSGANPAARFSRLEHRWTINVAAGSQVELHVEGFRTNSSDGDNFHFEYSTNGGTSFTPVALGPLALADDVTDLLGLLPATLTGNVLFRVVDTNRTPGTQSLDTVSIDELFVRSVP